MTENKELKDRLTRLEYESQKLLDAAAVVLQSEDFPTAARAVFDIAKELTGASSGYVALLSDDGTENEVLFLDSGGLPCTVDESLPMPIRGLREVAYRENRPAYENSFMESKWVNFMPDGHVTMHNVLFGPLVIGGKAEGLIGLANKPSDFTEDDTRIVMALSNLVAIGLNRTKIEAELRQSQKRLADTVDELQLYSSLLHHDISNEIQLIVGEIELARINAKGDTLIESHLDSIDSATSRMTRLLQVFEPTSIAEEDMLPNILHRLVTETKTSYPKIGISLHIEPVKEKVSIKGKSLIPFVFDNLVRNTVQHVGPNAEIEIYLSAKKDRIVIDFVDNGPGIDASIKGNLFQKGVSATKGGFGLYLCRKIIKVYEGSISLLDDDIYDKGTAFRIELPRIHEMVMPRDHTGY